MGGGDGIPWPAAGADFFGIFFFRDFFAIFYLFSWEFGGHAITPCDSLSAQLTVP